MFRVVVFLVSCCPRHLGTRVHEGLEAGVRRTPAWNSGYFGHLVVVVVVVMLLLRCRRFGLRGLRDHGGLCCHKTLRVLCLLCELCLDVVVVVVAALALVGRMTIAVVMDHRVPIAIAMVRRVVMLRTETHAIVAVGRSVLFGVRVVDHVELVRFLVVLARFLLLHKIVKRLGLN